LHKLLIGILALVMIGSAHSFMKITLVDGFEEEALTEIENIFFEDGVMTAANTYELKDIVKIEFTHAHVDISQSLNDQALASSDPVPEISMFRNGTICRFRLPTELPVRVRLYSLNGRRITTLFEGIPNNHEFDVSLGKEPLRSGVYSIVLERGNQIYAWKLIEGGNGE
jgi:hypothetical protein